MIERNVTIPSDNSSGASSKTVDNLQASRTNSPRGSTQSPATRSSLSSSRVSSPIGLNRGLSDEKSTNLSASTNAINSSSANNGGRSENRVHFDLKNSDLTKSQGSINASNRKAGNLSTAGSTVRRLTTSQPHHLSALPLDARQRLEEMVSITYLGKFHVFKKIHPRIQLNEN